MKITGFDGDIIASNRHGAYENVRDSIETLMSKIDNAYLYQQHSGIAYYPEIHVDLHSVRAHVTIHIESDIVQYGSQAIIDEIEQQLFSLGYNRKQVNMFRAFSFVDVADIWTDYQY